MLKKVYLFFINQPAVYKILLGLFALVFEKSLFIFPFTLMGGIAGVVIGLLLWLAVYAVCIVAVYLFGKVSWKYKKTAVRWYRILFYMLPPLTLSIFLLLVFFPGKMSYDSMYIWYTTVTGQYTNLHPITYTLFVDLLNNIVDSPWIVITVQFIYVSFVFGYIGYVFETMGLRRKLCWVIIFVLALYPVNFQQSVTMLKDVPYMMSLVLISAIMLKIIVADKITFGNLAALFAASMIAMFSRHNGLLSVPAGLVIFIIYYLAAKNKIAALRVTALLAAVIICFFGTNKIAESALSGDYWQRSSAPDMLMMPSAQCSYTILKNENEMSDELKTQADRFFDVGYIYYQEDTYYNWAFNNRYLDTLKTTEILNNKRDFVKFYFDLFKAYPKDMLLEYQQITGIIWAIPDYGYTLYRNVGITEYNGPLEIAYTPMFPKIAQFLDRDMKIIFWLRPALWLMLSVLLLFASSKRHGMKGLCLMAPMIANAIMFFAGTPAQNVRYFYCNFSIFIICLVFSLNKETDGQTAQ